MHPSSGLSLAVGGAEAEQPDDAEHPRTWLAAYALGGANAGSEERASGSLEAGKHAGLVVLDRNLFAIPPGEISDAKVLLTLFEGRPVFGSFATLQEKAAGKGGL